MLTEEAIERVRRTWALAASDPQTTSNAFYANLFRVDPSTKPLFVGNIQRQGMKLAQTLSFVVDHLDDLETLQPAAEDLAVRHVAYQVTEPQYASVGEALILTFKQLLGAGFSAEDEAAWVEAYGLLSSVMTQAAYHKA